METKKGTRNTSISKIVAASAILLLLFSQFTFLELFPRKASAITDASTSLPNDFSFSAGMPSSNAMIGRGSNQTISISGSGIGPDNDHYVQPIQIDNTLGSTTLTNYLASFSLDTQSLIVSGEMQYDCGDIRLVDSDHSTPLTFINITGCNTSNTTIKVVVPSVAASSSKSIYMYYGSPTVQSSESIPLTANSFTDSMTTQAPAGTLTQEAAYSSANQAVNLTHALSWENGNLEYTFNPGSDFDTSWKLKSTGGSGADSSYLYVYCTATPTSENGCTNGYEVAYDEYQNKIILSYNNSQLANFSVTTIGNGNWHSAELNKTGNVLTVYYDGTAVIAYTDSTRTITGMMSGFGARNGGGNNNHYIRDVTLNYSASTPLTMPSVTPGSPSNTSPTYNASDEWQSENMDLGKMGDWGDSTNNSTALTMHYTLPTTHEALTLSAKTDSGFIPLASVRSGSSLTLTKAQLDSAGLNPAENVQLKVAMSQTDNSTPIVSDITLQYTLASVPSAPTNIAANGGSSSDIALSWEAPPDNGGGAITGYDIYYKAGTGGQTYLTTTAGNSLTYTISRNSLMPNMTYQFFVDARNIAGTGNVGASNTLTTSAGQTKGATTASSTPEGGTTINATGGTNETGIILNDSANFTTSGVVDSANLGDVLHFCTDANATCSVTDVDAHTVILSSIDAAHNSVVLTFHSNPFTEIFYLGQPVDVDVDGDSIPDIQVTLNTLTTVSANLTFKLLNSIKTVTPTTSPTPQLQVNTTQKSSHIFAYLIGLGSTAAIILVIVVFFRRRPYPLDQW